MDPRKSRFSPYEVRGGGPGGRQGFRTNQAGMQHPHPQHAPRDEIYGRERRPLFNDKMSGGGGAMMRPKGSYSRGGGNDARFQHERGGAGYSDFIQPSLSRASSSSSYHTAPTRRAGNQSRWEPAKRHNNNWDDDRDSFSNSNEDRTSESRLPAHIEQRVAREKPCRTLFVRNIQYNLKAHEMKDMFEKFGEVKEVFNLIESRGMIFVTFYDIRAAENAKESTQGMFLANRRIDVHYSLPKEEEENAKCDRTKNQGTLLFTLKNTDGWLQDDQLYDYFAQFGEVKVIRTPHFKHHTENNERRQRFVEFYDSRACVHAYDSCHGHEYKGGRWDVSFFWDHTNRERSEAFAAKKERPLESRPAKPDRREPDRRPRRDFGGGGRPPRRHHDDERRGSYDDFGRTRYEPDNRSMSPLEDRAYNPESYTSNEDRQRLEQAQKAQQLLTMFAQTQDEGGSGSLQQQQQVAPGRAFQQSTYPPVQQRPIPPVSAPPPQAVPPPLPTGQPVATDQASQMQQLLGLLTQVAATQQQYQQQQAQPPPVQQPVAVPPPISQPPGDHQQPSAPITDPAIALNQLAQILQNQQHQQQQQQQSQQPSYPPVSMPPGGWTSEPQ
ncbi:hypothetical protein BJV82DRAFT_715796 [Fennellomyces sp. T-0311]|nr:hypothetical protein BJV82DRAFT_715796 [Fennellomyces sp. T-0311]